MLCLTGLWLLVSIWFQVLFHSSFRGTFHLSLTVLVHYRSRKIFSLGRRSSHIPTSLHVASSTFSQPQMVEKNHYSPNLPFIYGAITLFGCPFQVPSIRINLLVIIRQFPFRSPLLRESHKINSKCKNQNAKLITLWFCTNLSYLTLGECCFLFLRLLRCFSSPSSLPVQNPQR